jgi:hypothetical protein
MCFRILLLGMIHRTGKRALHAASPIITANGLEENGRRQSTSESNTEVKGFVVLDICKLCIRYSDLFTLYDVY